MKEFGCCLCWKARISALPLFPKSAGSSFICNGFARSFESKPPPGYIHKCTERFLHMIWRCFSKSLDPEECPAFNSCCFLTSQAADCVRDMTASEVWLLQSQPQKVHSGKYSELQWLSLVKSSCCLSKTHSIPPACICFQLLSGSDEVLLKCIRLESS